MRPDGKPRDTKEIYASAPPLHKSGMTDAEFERRIIDWAVSQPGAEALVQIGSRVQPDNVADKWSDWDFQLIVRSPERYFNRSWPNEIAPCWSAHFERTERGVIKLSAVFEGGLEADFVLLSAWQMKLVCWAMKYPRLEAFLPSPLAKGVRNLQMVSAPGFRVLLGGVLWEKRYSFVTTRWLTDIFSANDFEYHTAAFWRHSVWVAKKILRGELRAAVRWSQVELAQHTWALLAEEARLEGRAPRPEARQAERWLSTERCSQTLGTIGPEQGNLANALLAEVALFEDLSRSVASHHGFKIADRSALQLWLRDELSGFAGASLSSSPTETPR